MPQCRLRFVWDENSLEHCQTRVHCISRLEVNSVETIRLLRAKEQWRFARSIQTSPPPLTSLPSPSTHCILSILRINVDSIPVPTSYEEVFGETRDPSGEREKEVGWMWVGGCRQVKTYKLTCSQETYLPPLYAPIILDDSRWILNELAFDFVRSNILFLEILEKFF